MLARRRLPRCPPIGPPAGFYCRLPGKSTEASRASTCAPSIQIAPLSTISQHVGLELESKPPASWPSRLLRNGEGTLVCGSSGELRRGLRPSGASGPDLLPALAALACLLPDASIFSAISRLRGKESDRVEAIRNLVAVGGARSHLEGDRLHIEPANPPRAASPVPIRFDARGDHRMIMAAATLAVLIRTRLDLDGTAGVEKSFPGFFGQLALAGIELC